MNIPNPKRVLPRSVKNESIDNRFKLFFDNLNPLQVSYGFSKFLWTLPEFKYFERERIETVFSPQNFPFNIRVEKQTYVYV